MGPTQTTFQAVLATTRRVPLDRSDMQMVKAYKTSVADTPKDVVLHPMHKDKVKEAFDNGFIVLSGRHYEADFAFVKIAAGRSLFGGQKSRVNCYVAIFNELIPGPSYKDLGTALAAINDIHKIVESKIAQAEL
jgi:hypothetical protein